MGVPPRGATRKQIAPRGGAPTSRPDLVQRFLLIFMFLFPLVGLAQSPAETTFAQAEAMQETDLDQARALYLAAALQFAETDDDARFLYNAGNAFFLAGEPGRGIASYRRAQQLPATPMHLEANLDFVRRQAGNPEEAASRPWLNRDARKAVTAMAWLVAWGVIILRMWTGRAFKVTKWAALITAGVASASLIEAPTCRGVIVAERVEARKGPHYSYAPAFTANLRDGIECEIERQEDDWLLLHLTDDASAWVPASTVEIWRGQPSL